MAGTIDFANCPRCGGQDTLMVEWDTRTMQEYVHCSQCGCGYQETSTIIADEELNLAAA